MKITQKQLRRLIRETVGSKLAESVEDGIFIEAETENAIEELCHMITENLARYGGMVKFEKVHTAIMQAIEKIVDEAGIES